MITSRRRDPAGLTPQSVRRCIPVLTQLPFSCQGVYTREMMSNRYKLATFLTTGIALEWLQVRSIGFSVMDNSYLYKMLCCKWKSNVVSVVAFYNSVFFRWLLLSEPKYRLLYWHESECTCRPIHSHSLNIFVCNTIRFFWSKPMPSPVNDLLMSPIYLNRWMQTQVLV